MRVESKAMDISLEQSDASKKEAQQQLSKLKKQRNGVQETNERLLHEVKMIEAMEEEDVDMHVPIGTESLHSWMHRREEGLRHHWQTVRTFLQEQSRHAIVERFGTGPHFVQATVQIQVENHQTPVLKKFVIEMASTDDVPHSVFLFLDSVDKKLWDDTIFLHHEGVEHVLAAVPLDYQTQNMKHDALQELETQSLAFPEYSPNFSHQKYTLGFANVGPTFYINTADNTKTHGPGGQAHHQIPGDADPCFARVIAGIDVVDTLIRFGAASQNRVDPDGDHPWGAGDHTWTRIVSLEVMQPYNKGYRN